MGAIIHPWILTVTLFLCVGSPLPAQWRHYTGPRGGGTPGFDFDQFSELRNGRPIREPYADWDWWWDLNQDRFLRPERMVLRAASSEGQSPSGGGQSPSPAGTQRHRQETLELFRAAAHDALTPTRIAATLALGKLGGAQDHELMAALQAALADDHPHVAWSACLALGLLGSEDALPFLLELVRGDEETLSRTIRSGSTLDECRFFATVAIGLIGHRHRKSADDPVVIQLLQLARSLAMPPWMRDGIPEDPPVGPGRPHQPVPTRRPPHNGINRQRDLAVGAAIALQLMRIDGTAEAILEMAKDAALDDYVRSHLVIALGKCGATRVVPDLVALLDDRRVHVSRSAAIALGLLASPRDAMTLAALTRCALTAPDRSLRNFAIIALGEIGD